MADFRARILGVLDGIYRFTAAKTYTDKLDLNAPIQLVHDVSREAELGSGKGLWGGYATLVYWGVNHPGAGQLRYVIDPYVTLLQSATPLDPVQTFLADQLDMWLISFQVHTDTVNEPATRFTFTYVFDDVNPTTGEAYPVAFFEGSGGTTIVTDFPGTGSEYLLRPETNSDHLQCVKLPFLFPHTGRVAISSQAGAACNVFVHALVWVGSRGTAPPGMR